MKGVNKVKSANPARILTGTIIFIVLLFLADYLLPEPISISVLYVVAVLLTLFLKGKKVTAYIAILSTFAAIGGFLFSNFSPSDLLNLLVSVAGLWTGFVFVIKYKNHTMSDAKNRERLRALFDFATEGIMIANRKGEIVMINPIAEFQFGYQNGELDGKKIELLIPERMSERHVKHREKYVHKPYPRVMGQGMS